MFVTLGTGNAQNSFEVSDAGTSTRRLVSLACDCDPERGAARSLAHPALRRDGGHIASTVSLSAAIVLLAACTIGWIRPRTWGETWIIGACWLGVTIAFEFLGGHFLFGRPWNTLLADYNLSQGRIWIVVLVATAVGPVVAARTRHLFLHRP